MTHDELVQHGVAWLRRRTGGGCTEVFAEMVSPMAKGEVPDVIGWQSRGYFLYSHVIECKTSRADFLRDKKKSWRQTGLIGMGQRRYYLTPAGVLSPTDLTDGSGLLEVRGSRTRLIRAAKIREQFDAQAEAGLLLSAIRRAELGEQFNRRTARWEGFNGQRDRERTFEPVLRALVGLV
jgi:hypothetical protein